MDGKLHNEIITYSKSKEPQESCGFVVLVGSEKIFIPCENASEDKENHFEISPEDYIAASEKGEVLALVHSHPQGEPKLSQPDLQTQLYSQLDFWLVCDEQIHIFPKIPFLIGRDFKHGEMDCYTLFRDFYHLSGCNLPDFERDDYWWEDGFNLYLDNMAIYVGNQMVLHHAPKRLSKRDLYDGYWLKHTHSIWRYNAWSTLDFTAALNSLDLNLG